MVPAGFRSSPLVRGDGVPLTAGPHVATWWSAWRGDEAPGLGRAHPARFSIPKNRSRLTARVVRQGSPDAGDARVGGTPAERVARHGGGTSPTPRGPAVDFVRRFSQRTERPVRWVLDRLTLAPAQFYRWIDRYRRGNTPHGPVPRAHWLVPAERDAILRYHAAHAPEGYRRLAFMLLDADVVAVSPATVYRVLKAAGRLDRWNGKPSRKGTGFQQPLLPHEHWHIDLSYVNIAVSALTTYPPRILTSYPPRGAGVA